MLDKIKLWESNHKLTYIEAVYLITTSKFFIRIESCGNLALGGTVLVFHLFGCVLAKNKHIY